MRRSKASSVTQRDLQSPSTAQREQQKHCSQLKNLESPIQIHATHERLEERREFSISLFCFLRHKGRYAPCLLWCRLQTLSYYLDSSLQGIHTMEAWCVVALTPNSDEGSQPIQVKMRQGNRLFFLSCYFECCLLKVVKVSYEILSILPLDYRVQS